MTFVGRGTISKPLLDVLLNQLLKFLGDVVTTQGQFFFTIDENGRCRGFTRTGQTDANVGVFAFTRTIDDARSESVV